jgi:phosphatidylglycerophosphate synthase
MPQPIGTLVHALGHNWLGKADIAVQTVLLAAGLVVVSLRLWSRRLLQISWQWNDWFILGAVVRTDIP